MKRIILALPLIALSTLAFADLQKGSHLLSLYGGAGFTSSQFEYGVTGGEEPVADGGGSWGAQWVYVVKDTPSIGLGLDASISDLSEHRTLDLVRGSDSTSSMRSAVLLAIARLTFPTGRARPYIFAGIGAHRTRASISAKPYGTNTWSDTSTTESRVLLDETKSSLALGFGVGIDFYVTQRLFLGTEFRAVALGHRRYDQTAQAASVGLDLQKNGLDTQALLFRLGLQF